MKPPKFNFQNLSGEISSRYNRATAATNLNRLGNKFVVNSVVASAGLIIALLLLIVLTSSRLPPQVPLFYSLPWGEEQLAAKTTMLAVPLVSIATLAISMILSRLLTRDIFILRLLWLGCLFTITLGLITVARIILLVGIF
ncbi:hypothetical protein HY404_02310 [Candidatus Microgenomates bacterium]|nr:hypothetical protein [Candidatus Microgenomates bacterium]